MADNEIELVANIEAEIEGADSYASSVTDLATGTITAASSMLYLGASIDSIKKSLKNVDISKLSQIAQLKFNNLEQMWNTFNAKQSKNRSQVHFEQLFGTFNSLTEKNKAEQFIKSITDHNATGHFLNSKQKGEEKAAVLEEYNKTNREIRDKLLREAVGYRQEITSTNSKTSREVDNNISLLKEAFKNVQSQELSEYNKELQKEKLALEADNRNEESKIKSAYERQKSKIDSEYLSKMSEAQIKLSYATNNADNKRDSRMGALLASLETSKGVSYDSPEAIQKRIEEIGKIDPEYQRLKDEITKINVKSKQRVAVIGDLFSPQLTEIKKDKKRGQDSEEYIELHKKMIEYQEHAKRHYQRQIDALKAGKNNDSTVQEAIELEQLLKKYNDESSAILKDYNKEIRNANRAYKRRSTNARNTQARETHEAVVIRERDDKARVDLYGEVIKEKEALNASNLTAFKTQQQLTAQAFNETLLEKELTLKENQRKSLQEFNTIVQENVDVLNKEIGSTKNLISTKKEEEKTNAKIEKATKKANKYKGMSIRDALRDTLIRNEDIMMYRGGLRGFALRAAQNGWNRFADKKGIPNQVLQGKETIDGQEVATRGVNPVSAALTGLGAIGATITGLFKFVKDLDRFNSAFEESFKTIEALKTNLSVVYGSQSLANDTFSDISSYAIRSPFGVSQLTEMATLLRQSGVYSTDLLETLKMIGDTAGGNIGKMRNIATDYARIVAMGKANARELRTFAASGIPIYKELQKSLGITNTEVLQRARKGEIKSKDIEQAFLNMTGSGGVFENAVNINANTLMTRQQNLQDTIMFTKSRIGEASAEAGFTNWKMRFISTFWEIFENSLVEKGIESLGRIKKSRRLNSEFALAEENLSGKSGKELEEAELKYTEIWQKRINFLIEQEEKRGKSAKEIKKLEKQISNIDFILDKEGSYLSESEIKSWLKQKEILKNDIENIRNYSLSSEYADRRVFEKYLQRESDVFGKYGDEETSSKQQLFKQGTYFDKTAWSALEKAKEEEEELRLMNSLLGKQGYYGINGKDSFGWIKSFIERRKKEYEALSELEKEEVSLKDFESTDEIAKLISTFYSGESLDFFSPIISKEVLDRFSKNKTNIESLRNSASLNIDESIWNKWDEYFEKITKAEFDLSNAKSADEKTAKSEVIRKISGEFTKWIDSLKDESLKTILSSVFINPSEVILDRNEALAIEKHNHKAYAKFWERYAVKTLGISLDGMIEGRSALSQFIENQDRQTGTAIAVAMLKEKNIDQTLNRNLVYDSNGFNLAASRRNLELGAIDSRSSVAITQAYLSTLQSSIDTMANFLGGMPFTAEDAEKLYDPTWAHKMGYENSSQFVSAFTNATKAGGEALEIFNTNLKGSISSILEETKKRKENVEAIAKAKQASEGIRNKVSSAETDALAYSIYEHPEQVSKIYNTTSVSALSEAIKYLKEEYGLKTNDDVLKFMNRDLISGGSYSPIKAPARTGLLAQYSSLEEYMKASEDAIRNEVRGRGPSSGLSSDAIRGKIEEEFRKKYQDELDVYNSRLKNYDKQKSYAESNEALYETQNAVINITNGNVTIDDIKRNLEYRQALDGFTYDTATKRYVPTANVEKGTNGERLFGRFSDYKGFMGFIGDTSLHPSIYGLSDGRVNSKNQQVALNTLLGRNADVLMSDFVNRAFIDNKGNFLADEATDMYQRYAEFRKQTGKGPEIIQGDKSIKEQKKDLEEMITIMYEAQSRAEVHHKIMEGMKSEIASTLTGTATSALTSTMSILGEALRDSADASEKLAKNFKSLMQTMSASIGDAMVQAGLQTIINAGSDKGQWAKGIALLAAGGGLSLISGYLDEADDNDNDKDYERLNKIRDDLKDLLRQAREDSIYYENTVRHKKAISTNTALSGTHSVNDAIISPSGNVITTSPRDYLIATTNPHSLASGGTPNVKINFIDKSSGVTISNQTARFNDKTNELDLTVMIENKMSEFIASSKSDTAFAIRAKRESGNTYVG